MEMNNTNFTSSTPQLVPHYLSINYDLYTINQLILVVASLFFDIFILYHHWTHPAHPKYYLSYTKILSIWTHLVSGSIEIITAVVCFFVNDPVPWAYAMAAAVIAGHVPSSLYQTPNVFGLKSIMVPAYVLVISFHLAGGILIFLNPHDPKLIIGTILIQSIYVYCRMFYFILLRFNLFIANRYTISIMFSGMLLFPAATECYASNLAGILFIVVFNMIVYAYYHCSGQVFMIKNYWHVENHRETFGKHEEFTKSLTMAAKLRSTTKKTNEHQLQFQGLLSNMLEGPETMTLPEQARQVWNEIDVNGDGFVTKQEFEALLIKYGLSEEQISIERSNLDVIFGNSNKIDYVIFYRWFCGGRVAMKHLANSVPLPEEDRDKAKLVFDNLDIDSSGYLELWELETLLLNWGVSVDDAKRFLKKWDDGDGRVSFDEFYVHMRRIWVFAISVMKGDGRIYVTGDKESCCNSCCPVKDDQKENYVLI